MKKGLMGTVLFGVLLYANHSFASIDNYNNEPLYSRAEIRWIYNLPDEGNPSWTEVYTEPEFTSRGISHGNADCRSVNTYTIAMPVDSEDLNVIKIKELYTRVRRKHSPVPYNNNETWSFRTNSNSTGPDDHGEYVGSDNNRRYWAEIDYEPNFVTPRHGSYDPYPRYESRFTVLQEDDRREDYVLHINVVGICESSGMAVRCISPEKCKIKCPCYDTRYDAMFKVWIFAL